MPFSAEQILAAMTLWAAPFLRLSAMMLIAPIFSAAGFSVRTRVLLAVLVAALLAPVLPSPPVTDLFSANGLLMAIREVGVGFTIGFVLQIAFGAVVFAGQAVAMTMGLGFAMAVDPQSGVQVPTVSQFNVILTTLLFLAIDGHLALLVAVAESYQIVPAAISGIPVSSLGGVAALGSKVFAAGILLALPALTALLLVNVSFGVMTRAAPQLNIFAVGFPLTIFAGLIVMYLAMPGFIAGIREVLEGSLEQTLTIFG